MTIRNFRQAVSPPTSCTASLTRSAKIFAALLIGASGGASLTAAGGGVEEPAQSAGIDWRTSYSAAKAEAAETGKKVLLRFTAEWCPPCQIMNRNVWPAAEVQAVVAEDFVPVELDVDEPSIRPIAARYRVHGIPALILLNSNGEERARTGFASASELTAFLEEAGG